MPSVREQFKTYHDFASADLREIYGDRLDAAIRLEVTTAATGIFVNDGAANFSFVELPAEAQIAPTMGTAATHLDGDGQPDLVLAQNYFPNQRETGRMSGGLSLVIVRGPDGSFIPLPSKVSGIAVEGDARAVATPDLNGDRRPDLLFAHNSATPRFFINSAAGEFYSIAVEGSAIGTRLIFVHENGSREARDVAAGGGYMTQQSARLQHASPTSNPLKHIEIIWPDGTRSTAEVPPVAGSLVLRK